MMSVPSSCPTVRGSANSFRASSKAPEGDFSWVRPGKVAWEWWNSWNVQGVDFKAGINNETYKHYIDFASEYGVEYVILDEGWAVSGKADLFQIVPQIDVREQGADSLPSMSCSSLL